MFSGIVETTGRIVAVETAAPGAARTLIVDAPDLAGDVRHGESVSVNGCCLTAVVSPDAPASARLRFDVVAETVRKTTLGALAEGDVVNLERAMRADGRFDGHFVQGHVDGVGRVLSVEPQPGQTRVRIEVPPAVFALCVPQGSIAIDGVSLTLAALEEASSVVDVALIPTTLTRTILGGYRADQPVNVEADVLGKYVQAYLQRMQAPPA